METSLTPLASVLRLNRLLTALDTAAEGHPPEPAANRKMLQGVFNTLRAGAANEMGMTGDLCVNGAMILRWGTRYSYYPTATRIGLACAALTLLKAQAQHGRADHDTVYSVYTAVRGVL